MADPTSFHTGWLLETQGQADWKRYARDLYEDPSMRQIGRRFPHLVVPGPVIGSSTRLIDAVQRRLPERWRYPADREGVDIIRRNTRFDDSAARKELWPEMSQWLGQRSELKS